MRSFVLALCFALACHRAGNESAFGRVIERGGELGEVHPEDTKVVITKSAMTAWGVIEVPDGSRMQATYAGVDAIARAELLKVIRVRIADVMVSVESSDPARNDAYNRTVEVVGGSLRHAGSTQHAWERVQRGDERIMRVWSRLTVPRADVEAALEAQTELPLPPDMLDAME